MGAYSPLPDLPDDQAAELTARFHVPILRELARRGEPFRGALYAGLILTADGPVLLECNARFGDPETQVILPRIAGSLGPWLLAAARGRLPAGATVVPTLPGATAGVVLAAGGYPGTPERGAADRRPRCRPCGRGPRVPRGHRAGRGGPAASARPAAGS